MNFTCEVTARDDGTAVEWCEARADVEWCVLRIGYLGGALAFFVVVLGQGLARLMMAAILFGLSCGIVALGMNVAGKRRAIHFKRGGAIESPHGLFGGIKVVGPWETILGDIANIEMEQIVFPKPDQVEHYTHGVRMILKSGRVFHIAGNLMPDQAHELAVSLSQAREAMRYDVSTVNPRARSREAVY